MMGAGLALAGACAPSDGDCVDNSDCAFGQMCLQDQCVAVRPGGSGGVGFRSNAITNSEQWGFQYETQVPASLTGSIANAEVNTGVGTVFSTTLMTQVKIADGALGSTFMAVDIADLAVLTTPGRVVLNTDGVDGNSARACNYDTAAYDEAFTSVTIDVGDSRPATIGEVRPIDGVTPSVVEVVITMISQRTSVVGTAIVPIF